MATTTIQVSKLLAHLSRREQEVAALSYHLCQFQCKSVQEETFSTTNAEFRYEARPRALGNRVSPFDSSRELIRALLTSQLLLLLLLSHPGCSRINFYPPVPFLGTLFLRCCQCDKPSEAVCQLRLKWGLAYSDRDSSNKTISGYTMYVLVCVYCTFRIRIAKL